MKINVDVFSYIAAHGRGPRGRGSWAFSCQDQRGEEITKLWFGNVLYTEARAKARKLAPAGTVNLEVLS